MKKFILQYWWALIAFMACVMFIMLVLFMTAPPTVFETIVGILLLLTLIALLASWVILLINKQWLKCLLSFVLSLVTIVVLGGMLAISAMWGPGYDNFGKKHKIPDGLEYSIPLESSASSVEIDSLDTNTYLQIRNGSQGGIYDYDFYYGAIPAGEVFLRCFEITKDIPLSEDRLQERIKVAIDSTKSFSQLVHNKNFTIYEGDWGDYYAARVEVWHIDAKTGKETMLMEKVYRVEGWMR